MYERNNKCNNFTILYKRMADTFIYECLVSIGIKASVLPWHVQYALRNDESDS